MSERIAGSWPVRSYRRRRWAPGIQGAGCSGNQGVRATRRCRVRRQRAIAYRLCRRPAVNAESEMGRVHVVRRPQRHTMYRSLIYRLGRHLYAWARGDLPNKPATNGEYWLVEKVIERMPYDAAFLDIGANKGDWTERVLACAAARRLPVTVRAFEPSAQTRQMLVTRFWNDPCVEIHATAMSDQSGTAIFHSNRAGSGTNSLHPISGHQQETVTVTTLDEFLSKHLISHVTFAKIDVEGFDALVIKGAINALARSVFDLIQFEYNWRWILNSLTLKNIFQLVENLPYRVGKLAGDRILIFDEWHFEMDRYFENNYVLIRKDGPFENLGVKAHYDISNTLRY